MPDAAGVQLPDAHVSPLTLCRPRPLRNDPVSSSREKHRKLYLFGACRHRKAWKTRASKSAVASSKALPTQPGGSFLET